MARHNMTDSEWGILEPLLPKPAKRGRPSRPARQMLDGMLWILRTGSPWRDLPDEFGPWGTVYYRFNTWRKAGVWGAILQALTTELHQKGEMDHSLWCIDGTTIRSHRDAAGAGPKGGPATMPWDVPGGASPQSSTCSATAEAMSLPCV